MGFKLDMLLNPDFDVTTLKTLATEDTQVRAIYTHLWLEKSQAEVAEFFLVSQSTISRWLVKAFTPKPETQTSPSRCFTAEDIRFLTDLVNEQPLLYLKKIADILEQARNIKVSIFTIHRALVNQGYTYKKFQKVVRRAKREPIVNFVVR
ncbi:hypothetical protein P9112_010542 [Eukaryota sp. TZLM1-RC]